MAEELDYATLAQDNIRTLSVPETVFSKPVGIILVGGPVSGKTFLTKRLSDKFPLTVLSEEAMTTFMAPRATIFKRGTVEVFKLAIKTIENLIKIGKAVIYDANTKTKEERDLIKTIVEQEGGQYVLIYVDCPKEICYERLRKHNLSVTRGEKKGFVMDKDYFEYEVASTHQPTPDETHITFNCQNSESIFEVISTIGRRFGE